MTPPQKETLDYVRSHYAQHGSGPTQRQIAHALGRNSPSSVNKQLRALVDYGFLKRKRGFAGNYVPVDVTDFDLGGVPTSALEAELDRRSAASRMQ